MNWVKFNRLVLRSIPLIVGSSCAVYYTASYMYNTTTEASESQLREQDESNALKFLLGHNDDPRYRGTRRAEDGISRILQGRTDYNDGEQLQYKGRFYRVVYCRCDTHGDQSSCYFVGPRLEEVKDE